MRWSWLAAIGLFSGIATAATPAGDRDLASALAPEHRTPGFVTRDASRHPAAELAFFGLKPTDTVVELWPGGGYWTEILAPYLKAKGKLYEAPPPDGKQADSLKAMLGGDPKLYDKVTVTAFGAGHVDSAPAGSADLVLTFRNLHNWMDAGFGDDAIKGIYASLKPGGVLGIEEHRGDAARPQDPKADDGYVREDYAIAMIEKAGFKLAGKSEINANPKDTKNWPKGVWTLPPTFALGDKDRAKYAAIGEADNFVLKFVKPAR